METMYYRNNTIRISMDRCDRIVITFKSSKTTRRAFEWCKNKGMFPQEAAKVLLDRADVKGGFKKSGSKFGKTWNILAGQQARTEQ